MKISRKNKHKIDIADSGALSDLAFLLIVFFIVIAVFNINKGFVLSLPQKNSSKVVNVKDIIKLSLMEDNKIFYEDSEVSITKVESIIKETLNLRPNMTVLLSIHPESRYQNVVDIVNTISKLNVENFSFVMISEDRL